MTISATLEGGRRPFSREAGALLVRLTTIMLIAGAMTLVDPGFASVSNLLNLVRQASLLFLVASGLTLVVIGGGLDLSIGANLTLSACLAAAAIKATGSPWSGVAVAPATGMLVGAANGVLINRLKLPPFLATFGMLWVAQGIAYWFMAGQAIYGMPPSLRYFGTGFFLGIPLPIWIMLSVSLGCTVLLTRTTFGRESYFMGANQTAAFLSGIPVERRRFSLYVLSGLTAGVAGLIYLARLNAAEPGIGEPVLLPAIAAVLVGGTSLFGGSGNIIGTVLGAILLTIIVNGLNLLNISASWHPFVNGAVVLIALLADYAFGQRPAR
jgi:ribose transport system permease protein